MICEKCFHKVLTKDKKKAMKDYNKKLKKERYEKKGNTPKDKV